MRTRSHSQEPPVTVEEPIPKRIKKQSEERVCIVLRPFGPPMFKSYYYIYFLDLDNPKGFPSSSSIVRRNASIQLAGMHPVEAAYFVVDSTLYIFGGVIRGVRCATWQEHCYSYDLLPLLSNDDHDNPGCKLDFSSMEDDKYHTPIKPILSMNSEKVFPRAVLICGRICVFSNWFNPLDRPCASNFELYDPDAKTWLSLPEPPIIADSRKTYEVKFFCVEDSKLFISTNLKGSFCIDLGQPFGSEQPKWVPYDFPDLQKEYGISAQAVLKVGNLLLTPSLSVHNVDGDTTMRPPEDFSDWVKEEQQFVYASDRAIIRLPSERLKVCYVEAGGPKRKRSLDGEVFDPVLQLTQVEFDASTSDSDSDGDSDSDSNGDDPSTDQLWPTVLSSTMLYVDETIYTYKMKVVGAYPM